mgnify:CR=1 FL=1
MYCIGLTGTIASGKSTVSALFKELGIDVINADQIARQLVQPHEPAFQTIIQHFGSSILTETGELNRRHLRDIITENASERTWLESLLHPLIRKKIEQDINHCKSPYCMIEIPLLTDKESYPYLNRVLLITAMPKQQIARLMERDKSTKKQARAFWATTQANETKRHAIADETLLNDGTINALKIKVNNLHHLYLQKANS